MIRFEKILCEAGPGESRERLLGRAVGLALHHQATLTVVDVVEPRPCGWEELERECPEAAIEAARARLLERALTPFRRRLDIDTRVVNGVPFLCVVREVLRGGYDLVIRESEDPDWLDRVLGSDDMQLLRQCPCPVWFVDPSAPRSYRHVLAAVDVDRRYPEHELGTRDALNRRILDLACSIALAESAELHVVHAWHAFSGSYPGMPAALVTEYVERTRGEHEAAFAALLGEMAAAIGAEAASLIERHEHLVDGHARRAIPRLAKRIGADLVVMGSVARSGIPGLFVGNTAETILDQLDGSVLVVKPPGFVTPVSTRPRASASGDTPSRTAGDADGRKRRAGGRGRR